MPRGQRHFSRRRTSIPSEELARRLTFDRWTPGGQTNGVPAHIGRTELPAKAAYLSLTVCCRVWKNNTVRCQHPTTQDLSVNAHCSIGWKESESARDGKDMEQHASVIEAAGDLLTRRRNDLYRPIHTSGHNRRAAVEVSSQVRKQWKLLDYQVICPPVTSALPVPAVADRP